jgi:DNA modification methylase
MSVTVLEGDSRTVLATLPEASVQCCVTSPPYFGLRDYGHDGQIGLEPTPYAYVAELVALFREVRRVLTDDGTLWLNLGDSYAAQGGAHGGRDDNQTGVGAKRLHIEGSGDKAPRRAPDGVKPKDLIGIPWRVAFALQADGWYLRSDIIWHKPNPMPESVTDRPTKAHEYVFLLTKSARYFYDAKAISEPVTQSSIDRVTQPTLAQQIGSARVPGKTNGNMKAVGLVTDRNARTVWSITTQPFKGAHFATMPPELARRCILAGSKPSDTVLDPFGGAGTTGLVADRLGRDATLIELNSTYAALARQRITGDAPLFVEVTA